MFYSSMVLKSFKPLSWACALMGFVALFLGWKIIIKPHEMKRLQRGAVQTAERLRTDISEQVITDLASLEQIYIYIEQEQHKTPSTLIDALNLHFKRMHALESMMIPSRGIKGSLILSNPYGTYSGEFVSKKQCDQRVAEYPERVNVYKNMRVYPLDNVLCVYDPVLHMFAVLNLKVILEDYLKKERLKGYFLALFEDASSEISAPYWKISRVHHELFDFFGTHWSIKTYPSKAHVEASMRRDFVVFFLSITGLLGLYFWWVWRRTRPAPADADYVTHLKQLALYDGLTNLPNRRHCLDHLNVVIKRAKRHRGRFAVCFMDCDGFKQINDEYGHPTGDAVLKHIADVMAQILRKNDFFARFSGDEFCLILEDTSSPEGIQACLDKVFEALSKPVLTMGYSISVTMSIGVAVYPESGNEADVLLKHADEAMYLAKRNESHAYIIYLDSL